jgi:hypothetical protein
MYSHSYAMVLFRDRQRDLVAAAERRNRTAATRPRRSRRSR